MKIAFVALILIASQIPMRAQDRKHEKVIDKKFLAVMGVEALAKSTDFMITAKHMGEPIGVQGPSYVHSCAVDYPTGTCWEYVRFHENNPLFGRYPSNGRLVGENIGFFAAETLLTYELKKHRVKFWFAPVAYFAANHTRLAWSNTRY